MDIRGKKVTVVGLGQTAVSLTELLLSQGACPFVTDHAENEKQRPWRDALEKLNVPCETGGHTDAAFDGASLVIPSPGVPPGIAPIVQAVSAGAEVLGEMEFASRYCRSRVLAVTGTNGKTTTTELLRCLVESAGHSVVLAGNNAFPFSAAVQIEPVPEYIVLEVSSYQLETAKTFRPYMAAVLNVTPDHFARHKTLENYADVKASIFAHQRAGDIAVVNYDDPLVRNMANGSQADIWPFSLESHLSFGVWLDGDIFRFGKEAVATINDTLLRGRHNLQNVACALSMMRAGEFDWAGVLEGLRRFKGVEHRIEYVTTIDGVAYFNDSKSTNIDSLKVALEAFDVPVVLIAGGQGKGADYRVLSELMRRHVRKMITLGEDAPKLEEAFGGTIAFERATDMADAVKCAALAAQAGDAILLSPACASFDMYNSFEHRGAVFKEAVGTFAAGKALA